MPVLDRKLARRRFAGKLHARVEPGGNHMRYHFTVPTGGEVSTVISNGSGKDISARLTSRMARHLGVRAQFLFDAVDCTVDDVEFYQEIGTRSV